jgi:hypothetical protein
LEWTYRKVALDDAVTGLQVIEAARKSAESASIVPLDA